MAAQCFVCFPIADLRRAREVVPAPARKPSRRPDKPVPSRRTLVSVSESEFCASRFGLKPIIFAYSTSTRTLLPSLTAGEAVTL